MKEQFLNHIAKHKLFKKSDKVLLAVSGGMDSMVMLDLFRDAGFSFGVAHCNFQLRGEASGKDEDLVRNAAAQYGVTFHAVHFDTQQYADTEGVSIQMAARDLRYNWFRQLCKDHNYAVIATAHHLNDSLETVLLNFTKGTGLDGLAGIPVKNDNVVRPLLFATQEAIEAYAAKCGIRWREDESNASDYYQRNLIRHHVIPALKKINSSLEEGFARTVEKVTFSNDIVKNHVALQFERFVQDRGDGLYINKSATQVNEAPLLLFEWTKNFGFNYDQCKDLLTQTHQAGTSYYSGYYQLTVDREAFVLSKRKQASEFCIWINKDDEIIDNEETKLILQRSGWDSMHFAEDKHIAVLDLGKLQFPLKWRRWKAGDYFIPLGMKHRKKISDFLIDQKVPLHLKQSITVVTCNEEIVWVAGMRISDKFKVSESTKEVLIIKQESIG